MYLNYLSLRVQLAGRLTFTLAALKLQVSPEEASAVFTPGASVVRPYADSDLFNNSQSKPL